MSGNLNDRFIEVYFEGSDIAIRIDKESEEYKKRHAPRPGDQSYKWPYVPPPPPPAPIPEFKPGELVYHDVLGRGKVWYRVRVIMSMLSNISEMRYWVSFDGREQQDLIPATELKKVDPMSQTGA